MKRALIVEDSWVILHALELSLTECGIVVVATAGTVAEGLAHIALARFDFALVDLNLGGEMALPVVDALLAAAIPLILTTGYTTAMLPARFAAVPLCLKPYDFDMLREMIAAL